MWRGGGTGANSLGDYDGFKVTGNGAPIAWVQIGPKIKANYAFDDGSATLKKGMNPASNYGRVYYYSIPSDYFE